MERILIEHVDAITLVAGEPLVQPDLSIAIEAGRIRSLGPVPEGFEPTRRIDGRDRLAVPGLFNAHCHAAMTLVRGWAEDLPFDRWLNEKIWVAESQLEEEDIYWGAALAACEMIRAGVVGFADHYFWMDQVGRVVEESGLKALLAWCSFGLEEEQEVGGARFADTVAFARRWQGAADGRIRTAIGPHSPYMCGPQALRRAAEAAAELDVPVHLHLAESDEQVAVSRQKHGVSPVQHVARQGLFEVPVLAAHCISLDDDDLALLAAHRVHVAHTPKTYMKLAMGMTPLQRLAAAGVPVALGSDGPASNSDLNLLEVMRLVGLVQKFLQGDAEAMPLAEILRAAAPVGARALGFVDSGQLAPGASADLVLLRTDGPHWAPGHDLAAGLVYSSQPADVELVMVDGRTLLEGGELTTLDEDKICHEARARARRIVGADLQQMREYRG